LLDADGKTSPIFRRLLAEWYVERPAADKGISLPQTSGEQRHDAHRFYIAVGFSPRSARFVKTLP